MRQRYFIFLLCLLLAPALAWAQAATTVRGVVKDAVTGEPLPSVTVLVKGTTQGTASNADGSYSVGIPAGGATLVFSYVGYLAQELPVTEGGTKDINLKADTKQLDDVVVVGYGSEWRWGVEADYQPMRGQDKIGFWKCPYHNARACLEVLHRCRALTRPV